jgi:hypothetical protein
MTQFPHSTDPTPPPVLADRFWRDLFVHGRGVLPYIGNYFEPAKPTKRRRKPSIATLLKQAEETGQRVTSITTADGTTLNFGESKPTDEGNAPRDASVVAPERIVSLRKRGA